MDDAEEIKIPIKEVILKQTGIANNWDHNAALGVSAKREKSGALTIKVAKLAKAFMMEATKVQPNSDPCNFEGAVITSPAPLAFTRTQIMKPKPANGTMKALKVNKCLI